MPDINKNKNQGPEDNGFGLPEKDVGDYMGDVDSFFRSSGYDREEQKKTYDVEGMIKSFFDQAEVGSDIETDEMPADSDAWVYPEFPIEEYDGISFEEAEEDHSYEFAGEEDGVPMEYVEDYKKTEELFEESEDFSEYEEPEIYEVPEYVSEELQEEDDPRLICYDSETEQEPCQDEYESYAEDETEYIESEPEYQYDADEEYMADEDLYEAAEEYAADEGYVVGEEYAADDYDEAETMEEPVPETDAAQESGHHSRKHGFFGFGRSHEQHHEEPQPAEPEIITPNPDEQILDDASLENLSEVDRRREELRRAKRQDDELQNVIASSFDAAMNEKKNGFESADRSGSGDSAVDGEEGGTATFKSAKSAGSAKNKSNNGVHISDDLRAFRNNTPDEAAAKAKRAVGYYSWRCAAVLVLALFSWYNTAAATYQWWQPKHLVYIDNPFIFLLVLCIVQIVAMFVSISYIADGLLSVIRLNFKVETLISLSCIINLFYTISVIVFPSWGGHLPCTAVALLGLAGGLFARRQRYKCIRWGCRAAARSEGYYCTVKGMRDQNGDVKTVYKTDPVMLDRAFMEKVLEEDRAEQLMHYVTPLTIIITLLFAVISSVGSGNAHHFMWHWSTLLAASVPCGLVLSRVMPFSAVASKLSRIGVSITGTSGLRSIATVDTAIVRETDLFPTKMVSVNSVNTFSGFTGEKVNLCTLSLLKASGSSLYDAFAASLPGQPMGLPPVEDFEFFETGGMGAFVNGEKVYVGTASFILRMGIRIPEGINLKNSIFVAINFKFAGIYSIKYDVQPSVRRSINYIVKHKIVPVLAVRDFNINEQLVESKFKISSENIGYPDLEERIAYSAIKDTELDEDCAVVAINNLHSYGEAVICGKRVHASERLNIIFGFLSLCIGVPLIFYLLFMGAFTVVTPANIFYYALLWLAPVIISTLGANRR